MNEQVTEIGGKSRETRPVLMTKTECAAFLGIKKRTLEKYMGARQIPFMRLSQKMVRFHIDDVMAALRDQN